MGHFKPSEFSCRCARPECDAPKMDPSFLEKLEMLRDKWGRPLLITSGLRCRHWNEKIGGAKKSQHLAGKAADLQVMDLNEARSIHALAEQLGFGGVEIGKGFIHVDTGPSRQWVYV